MTIPSTTQAVSRVRHPVLIDCDPGIDDAFALALAIRSPELDIAGVTVVAGNQTLNHVARNAANLVSFFGRPDIAVVTGAERPLQRDQITANSHGVDGLGGRRLAPSTNAPRPGGVDFLVDQILSHPTGTLSVIAIGPLTNLALALQEQPSIATHVRQVIIMGGAGNAGNMTPVAEFNFFADPEAADVVLQAGWPIVLLPLNLTWQSAVTHTVAQRFAAAPGDRAQALNDWLHFYSEGEFTPGEDGPALHDAVAVAYAIDPHLVRTVPAFVAVETKGTWTYGESVIDTESSFGHPANVALGVELDRDKFWQLMLRTAQ